MENFKILIGKIVGTPTQTCWAQTLVLENLFVVLEIMGVSPQEEEMASLGKSTLAKIAQKFQSPEKQNLAAFKKNFEEVLDELSFSAQINLAAVKIIEQVAYLAVKNGGTIFLKRGEILEAVLSGSLKDEKILTGSGFLKNDDLLILTTAKFKKIISKDELLANLDNFIPSEITERLSPKIHESEEGSGVACIILSLGSETYQEEERPKLPRFLEDFSQKKSLVIALFLILLLVLSILFGVRQRFDSQRSQIFKEKINQATVKYDEGRQLLDLNKSLAYQSFLEAKKILEEEKSNLGKNSNEEKQLNEFLAKLDSLLLQSGGVHKVDNPQTFFDLNLVKQGGVGTRLSLLNSQLVILDAQNKNVYSLNVSSKSSKIEGANLKSPQLVTSDGENIYFLGEEGVYKLPKDKDPVLIIKKDDSQNGFNAALSIIAFSGNIYLLDKGSSSIYKYMPLNDNFTRRNYLASDVKPDFSGATSMTIDGEVYVLLSEGTILKYFQGAPKSFRITGLDRPFASSLVIFTDQNLKNLYILDKDNGRVVVLDKEGNYQFQYQSEGIKNVSDFAVSESEKKIFLLAGNKIYSIELK